LSLQNDLTTARSQEIRALADYNKALAELYFSEGTILEKQRITVEK
jgi:outer membrane protein TolC